MRFIKQLYVNVRFFVFFTLPVLLFVLAYWFDMLFIVAVSGLAVALLVVVADALSLSVFSTSAIACRRTMADMLSLGDPNKISLDIKNSTKHSVNLRIIDELPAQLQTRDFLITSTLAPGALHNLHYHIEPPKRGEYLFGKTHIFIRSRWGMFDRRLSYPNETMVKVYPSVLQMKKYELTAAAQSVHISGIKKIRRLGHTNEFDHIADYVQGDDYRSINWKMTAKRHHLMVDKYDDEKSQQIYSIIDNSRAMRMPFNNLTLLDYAINTSLTLAKISITKYDKAGLITLHDRIGAFVKADRHRNQLKYILEKLYNEKEYATEANFELLYSFLTNNVKTRSLLFLYTNFDSQYALERVLPILRKINQRHLLVVVFFENTELEQYAFKQAATMEDVYFHSIAEKMKYDKLNLKSLLKQHSIHSIFTDPTELALNTINKYLEFKAKGWI